MTTRVHVRPASLADAPTLARLYREAYATNVELGFPSRAAEADRADLEAWIRETRVFVAVEGGKLVGSVRYRDQGKYNPESPEFGRLAVPPRARGRGIADTLLAFVEDRARRDGHDRLRLRTFAGHPFLPDVYRRRGYRDVRVRELEGAPFDVLHMYKSL
ncbi:GNAT family N-acetyltransferase [Halobacteria archaeon AArc-curdl1]|uniref:GNAT family N-acetyltransferase n=1 Tax=Natronosalvus hydrolyticus TaxID=2979988 RepID=A0AAP2ZAM5_9EURY|nr:GNAT family N-acetyltransferase [Halobacteria archaeon AArc-curdl1]